MNDGTMNLQRVKSDLLALGLLAVAVFAGLSIVSYHPADPPATLVFPVPTETANLCGSTGAQFAHVLRTSVGLGAWFVLFGLLTADLRLFRQKPLNDPIIRLFGFALSLTAVCVALQLLAPGLGTGPVIGSGGYVGVWGLALLEQKFSFAGTLILCGTAIVAGTLFSGHGSEDRLESRRRTAGAAVAIRFRQATVR